MQGLMSSGMILANDLRSGYTSLDGSHSHSSILPNITSSFPQPDRFTPYTVRGAPSAVPFAYGPPSFKYEELKAITQLQATKFEVEKDRYLEEQVILEGGSVVSWRECSIMVNWT